MGIFRSGTKIMVTMIIKSERLFHRSKDNEWTGKKLRNIRQDT